jgi:hypothetical protein
MGHTALVFAPHPSARLPSSRTRHHWNATLDIAIGFAFVLMLLAALAVLVAGRLACSAVRHVSRQRRFGSVSGRLC